jgi:hypothetical protein
METMVVYKATFDVKKAHPGFLLAVFILSQPKACRRAWSKGSSEGRIPFPFTPRRVSNQNEVIERKPAAG